MFDVTVVGAGPAGSYAAYRLAEQGFDVLIVDREQSPREKTCGGGVSKKTLEILQTHDIDCSPVAEQRVTSALLTYGNRDTVVKELGSHAGLTTLRSAFDHLILSRATEEGADFRPGVAFESAVKNHRSRSAPTWTAS